MACSMCGSPQHSAGQSHPEFWDSSRINGVTFSKWMAEVERLYFAKNSRHIFERFSSKEQYDNLKLLWSSGMSAANAVAQMI